MSTEKRFRDSHVPPLLRRQVYDLCAAIQTSLNQVPRLAIPALILLYAGIDGMAWVSVTDGRLDVEGRDFQTWAKIYLLPGSGLDCDEADLWAARCGLVHAQIMDSRSARQGHARHIWYYVGPGNCYLIPIGEKGQKSPVTLDIDVLVDAFVRATRRFFDAIETDRELERVVWPRAARYYDEMQVFGRPGDEGSWVATIPPDFGAQDED
jgi:hypothetical protein